MTKEQKILKVFMALERAFDNGMKFQGHLYLGTQESGQKSEYWSPSHFHQAEELINLLNINEDK
jgi:hypothetical protein